MSNLVYALIVIIVNLILLEFTSMRSRSRSLALSVLFLSPLFLEVSHNEDSTRVVILLLGYLFAVGMLLFKADDDEGEMNFFHLILPWYLLVLATPQSIVELTIFVVGIHVIYFISQNKKVYGDGNLLNYIVSNLLTIIIFSVFVVVWKIVAGIGNGTSNFVYQGLVLVYCIHLVGGFGSFSWGERTLLVLDRHNVVTFKLLNLFIIPVIVFMKLKEFIEVETILSNDLYFVFILSLLVLIYTKDLIRGRFVTSSYSIVSYNMLSAGLVYVFVNGFTEAMLMVLLVLNIALYSLINSQKNIPKNISWFLVLLLVGTPFSPFFIYKFFYLKQIFAGMSPLLTLVFSVFLFIPLLWLKKFHRKEVYE
ncbi:MAG: hypothetical protein HON90_10940 [Halobacteriovoraceae bacterium]|jgi:hypothetical protein|nr:hypothetical protein [Halobacteriovoraceae bacterium]